MDMILVKSSISKYIYYSIKKIGILLFIALFSLECSGPKNGDREIVVDNNGVYISPQEIYHGPSKIVWLRCPIGQTFESGHCIGEPIEFSYQNSRSACFSMYRLPKIEELVSLLDDCDGFIDISLGQMGYCKSCAKSKKCSQLFPDDYLWYWSSTNRIGKAWGVGFRNGSVGIPIQTDGGFVRCVREPRDGP